MASSASTFFAQKQFAVVGASADPSKFGNKVLRWYIDQRLEVVPVNPKSPEIESLKTITSLSGLANPTQTSVSVITPPGVTLNVLKEALSLGVPAVWLQPGCESAEVRELVEKEIGNKMVVLLGGPCILVLGEEALRTARL
ncbi:CoA-binding protein [Chytridium lagenaria]|nr:CoA-binding protein [Chytridium lagenaria]